MSSQSLYFMFGPALFTLTVYVGTDRAVPESENEDRLYVAGR